MIFKDVAEKYWAAGLPAIPLVPGQKRPAVTRWQLFADRGPSDDEKFAWLREFPDGNIGLPMGPAAGLVAVDIDTDDPQITAILDDLLPSSPWHRVGAKGSVRIYRYNGERTTRIKSDTGMICEILSKGTQIVLPPSIHPDTKRPYVANAELYDVLDKVPTLPAAINDLIRMALVDAGIDASVGGGGNYRTTTFVPAGARDNAMVWHAGLLSRAVVRGERTLLEALGEMEHWVDNFVEKVIGDELSVEKAQGKLIEFVIRDVTGEGGKGLPPGWDEGLSDEDKEKLGLSFTEDHEKWPAEKILEFLAVEVERHSDPNSSGRLSAIQVALDKVVRAGSEVSVLDEERILRFIQGQSMSTITVAALKKQLTTMRRGDIAGDNHEEIAKAVLNQLNQFGEVRFDAGKFWQWSGACWEERANAEFLRVIATDFGNYPACKRHSDYMGVLRTMQAIAAVKLQQSNISGINFANGFLTEDLNLIDHHPDHGMIYVLPYRYMPEYAGHMPMFNQYLADSWSHNTDYMDKVAALQEVMGATLFQAGPRYQRAVCCFGVAGSGKSRITAIMQGLLPKGSVSSIPPQEWGDKFLPAELFGKVMNFAGELSETKSIPSEIFKQIIEGEAISAQQKNQAPFRFRPSVTHWFNSNHLPKTRDTSEGFSRRWLILEWDHRVDVDKRIIDLDQQILEHEMEAIAAWAVQGYMRLKQNREYTLPASHLACVDQMAYDNNSVRYFLAQCPQVVVGRTKTEGMSQNETTAVDLHGEYWSFCIVAGTTRRVTVQKFQAMMKELQQAFEFESIQRATNLGSIKVVYKYVIITGA